jgi:hypothetical protein
LSRLLSTETKRYLREQALLSGKYIFIFAAVAIAGCVIAFGASNEYLERRYPTPREWTTISRLNWRSARLNEEPSSRGGLPDWAYVGFTYRWILGRLEDPKLDGVGLEEPSEGEEMLKDHVRKGGIDISSKGYEWREGYYNTLRSVARAAEKLDGWMVDTKRKRAFPGNVVIGPSNPDPRPCPPTMISAPREEDCVQAFEPPDVYYAKIMTTTGFTTRQKLDAALAWADWCEYEGLTDTAEEMYRWGVDLAVDGSPAAEPEKILDRKTGIIRLSTPENISPNILLATTALATFYARSERPSLALPIYLSVLRARRALPPAPSHPSQRISTTTPSDNAAGGLRLLSFLRLLTVPPAFPPEKLSGNEPATRVPASICDEAGLMAHIGEILFATSSKGNTREQGVDWTRQAVQAAETELRKLKAMDDVNPEGRESCRQCLQMALENWKVMTASLLKEERRSRGQSKGWTLWRRQEDDERWEREKEVVKETERDVRDLLHFEEEDISWHSYLVA